MIELIIFDWDDVFTKGATVGYLKCYHEAVTGVGINLTPEEELNRIKSLWGSPHREELGVLLKEQPELIDQACKIYEQHLFGETFVNSLQIMPGSQELLAKLAHNYKLAIASGANRNVLLRTIAKFKIPDVFVQIVSAYDLDDPLKTKPHPLMVQQILQQQKTAPEKAIMVGDAKNDVLMARSAGVEPVVVLTGYLGRKEAKELGVTHIIEDVTQLEPVLEKLNN